jgi:PAS domain S-box-containing protein
LRRAALGSAAILAVTLAVGRIVTWQAQHRWVAEQRDYAGQAAAAAGFTLEQQVSRSLSSTHTLAALVMRDERGKGFEELAAWLFPHFGGAVSLELAPGAVISRIYPLAGNEPAMGHDLLHDPDPRFRAEQAVNSRTLTVAGPFELRQGGVGLVGRLAVYLPDPAAPGGERFWGLVTAVVRVKPLLEAAQLARLEQAGYRYQLTWPNPERGRTPECFAGCDVALDAPVAFDVSVPSSRWTLLVAPRGGWPAPPWRALAHVLVCAIAVAAALVAYQFLRLPLRLQREVELRTAELRSANEELRVSEAEKALVLNSTTDLVTFIDPEMRIQWGNHHAAAHARTTLKELKGLRCFEAFNGRSEPCAGCPVELAMKTGEPQSAELSRSGGRTILLRAYPVKDEQGLLVGIVEFALDISDRKRTEEALRESEARARAILASLAEGIVLHDAEGAVVSANQAAQRLLGRPFEEMAGHTVVDGPPPGWMMQLDGSPFVREEHPVMLALRTGSGQSCELGMRRPDGSLVWLAAHAQPIRLPGGKVAGVVCSLFDVTQRRRALQRSEEHLRNMADSMPDAIIRFDRQLQIAFVNEAFATTFGVPVEMLVGKKSAEIGRELVDPAYAASWDQHLLDVFRTGSPARAEFHVEALGGRHCESRLVPERGPDGEVESVLCVTRDITERKQAEQQVLASREQLRMLLARLNSVREEEKARLSRELHDEMGQLLTALKMELEFLEDRLGDPGMPAEILERAVAASDLVEKTITSTRNILSALRPVALDRLGLDAALRQECRRFEEWAGVVCDLAVPDGVSSFGFEIDTALYRIAQEALTNVARHAGASRVAVSLGWRMGAAVLRVEDDGRGIPAGHESTGLGLLGMRERAERLGGEVEVKPAVPGGTLVEARIPADTEARRQT